MSCDFKDPDLHSISGHKTRMNGIVRNMSFRIKGSSITLHKDFYVSDMLDDFVDVIFGWEFMCNEAKHILNKSSRHL